MELFPKTLIIIGLALSSFQLTAEAENMNPPIAPKIVKSMTDHGITREDPYYWLRERENPKVRDHLKAENKYTESFLKPFSKLKAKLFSEMKGRIQETDMSVPHEEGGFSYYYKFKKGQEHPVYFRKSNSKKLAKEELLLDVNVLAKTSPFTDISELVPSRDSHKMGFGWDLKGRRQYTIHVKDLDSGKLLKDKIPETDGSLVWSEDGKSFYYVKTDSETLRSYRVYKHLIGTPPKEDVLVYEEKDATFHLSIDYTKSQKYLVIRANSTLTSEEFLLDLHSESAQPMSFLARKRGHEYSLDHTDDGFFIRSNKDSKNFSIFFANTLGLSAKQWQPLIVERPDVFIGGMVLLKGYIVLDTTVNTNEQIEIYPFTGGKTGTPYNVYTSESNCQISVLDEKRWDRPTLKYSYDSMVTPHSIFTFDLKTKKSTLLKQRKVLGGYNPKKYTTEKWFAKSSDGMQIPVTLVYKSGLRKNSQNPTLLYGYGAYGLSTPPYFSSNRLSLLDRGFIFVIAHVRGGQEWGREWYDLGRTFNKKNTFSDFIKVAETLVEKKYTTPSRLFAYGGSAGGLLIGAVINLRPDLFRAVIAAVPFVDVITTMLDPSIPLTTGEFDEWGNPKVKKDFEYIYDYSPYDQVHKKTYPSVLATTGFHDSQVQYWEPAKWVLKLRENQLQKSNPILLWTNFDAGHGGKTGRFEQLKEVAMEYSYFLSFLENRKL